MIALPEVGRGATLQRHFAKIKDAVRSSVREPFWREPQWKARVGESVIISTMINLNGSVATAAAFGFVPSMPVLGVYEVMGAAVGFAYPNLVPAVERLFDVAGRDRVPPRLAPVLHAGVRATMINVIGAVGCQALLNVPPDLAIALIFQGASMSTSLSYGTVKRAVTSAGAAVNRQVRAWVAAARDKKSGEHSPGSNRP